MNMASEFLNPKPPLISRRSVLSANCVEALCDTDKPVFIKTLEEYIFFGKAENVQHVLSAIKEGSNISMLKHYSDEEETVLHTAIKMRAHNDVISALIDACPDLLQESRQGSKLYKGQTALHIAITDGNVDAVELILQKANEYPAIKPKDLLCKEATGARFENTVMLGELPLSVATLTLNVKMFDKLVEHEAPLDQRNGLGDNLCHSLIRYSHLYPEKSSDILKMCEHIAKMTVSMENMPNQSEGINRDNKQNKSKECEHIWLMKNNDGLNPLQLAALLGQSPIFKFIMELKGVYSYKNSDDGLFDVELFDVTDIDVISELQRSKQVARERKKKDKNPEGLETLTEVFTDDVDAKVIPTLEMIFMSPPAVGFKFIHMSPLRYVISRKWAFYRWFYAIWGILHILFMTGYTVYAVRRSEIPQQSGNESSTNGYIHKVGTDGYVTFYAVLSLIVAGLYILQEVIRIITGRMPWTMSHIFNCYHNGPFRLVLILFSAVLIADVIWRFTERDHRNYPLVCAVVLGWWFLVFFLRGIRQFSFFTVMIQKIIVGDMFRFSIVIIMELIAFSTAMYISYRGNKIMNEDLNDYTRLFMMMFQMMFGFTNMDTLFEAPEPWFTVCIYVAFVLFTYILMINSLIAMMSNTCGVVSENRDMQYRVQQLSIILFFESILPTSALRMVGTPRMCDWYDVGKKATVKRKRYFMEVRSLREVTRRKEPNHMNTETMLESIFTTVMSKLAPEDEKPKDEKSARNAERVSEHDLNKLPAIVEGRRNNAASYEPSDLTRTNAKPEELDQTEKKKKRHKKRRPKVPTTELSGTEIDNEEYKPKGTQHASNKIAPEEDMPRSPRPYSTSSLEEELKYDHTDGL